ncbi:MAG TPA: DinB family protein [Fimbriimonadaceae bacterium]|nr:DinB family protein [Fimbriimonadaceae bacterium]
MELTAAVIESWDRNCRILDAVASRVDESNRHAKPSEDGWPIDTHLAHVHKVRQFHLQQLDPEGARALPEVFRRGWEEPLEDIDAIKAALRESASAVRKAMQAALESGQGPVVGYDHPLFLLQHLVWHEGWHVGLIFLALRLAGQEVPEAWEEARVWGQWRTD